MHAVDILGRRLAAHQDDLFTAARLLLRRIGLDPATSSAPFVATLVDVTGLIIYFTAAVALLRGTVL